MSSANSRVSNFEALGRLLIYEYIENNNGLKVVPCGTLRTKFCWSE